MGHRIEFMYFGNEVTKGAIDDEVYKYIRNHGDGYGTNYINFLPDICKTENQAYDMIDKHDKNGYYNGLAVRYYDTTHSKKTKKYEEIQQKIIQLQDQKKTYYEENHIKNKTVNYITCPTCGSKLARKYLHSNNCPCCGRELRSQKIVDKVKSFDEKIKEMKNKLEAERAKSVTKDSPIVWLVKFEYHE